jgi:hypothetical protein
VCVNARARRGDFGRVALIIYDVRDDLKKMKIIKWVQQAQDRFKWKAIVEKAKTLPEL